MHKVEKLVGKAGSFVTQAPKASSAKWAVMVIWPKDVLVSFTAQIELYYYSMAFFLPSLIQYGPLRAGTVSFIFLSSVLKILSCINHLVP